MEGSGSPVETDKVRTFETGATRDTAAGKYEYIGFLDSRVLKAYAAYMDRHRIQKDGVRRNPDNWKRGMPVKEYLGSLVRHTMDLWELHEYGDSVRPENGERVEFEETCCAILFNVMGAMREHRIKREAKE